MSVQSSATSAQTDTEALVDLIIDSIQDIKGKRIIKMDLRQIDEAAASFFVICQGESVTQVQAIAQNISRRVKDEWGTRPNHIEGITSSKWVLVDFFDVIVHVFYPETRDYYDLEELWSDAKVTSYEDID